ncbi:MAG TPA: sigma-70 family RNA polymerase sigma factor [Planctomycetota bacterium]
MNPTPLAAPCDALELDEIVRRHQQNVWRFLRALGADPALAEELAQDTFLLAWRKRLAARSEAETAAWLLRTARFLWLRTRRHRQRHEQRLADTLLEWWLRQGAADAGDRWLDALRSCRQQLGPRAAQALELFYADGLSRDAVASALGMRPNGTKTLLQRTRELLRDCIERRLA